MRTNENVPKTVTNRDYIHFARYTTNSDYLNFARHIIGDELAFALFFTVAEDETGLAFDVMDSKDFKEYENEFEAFEKRKADSKAWFLNTLVVLKEVDKRNGKATRWTDIR